MKFYKNSYGIFILDTMIVPHTSMVLKVYPGDKIAFTLLNGTIMAGPIESSLVKKQDGSFYSDSDEIISTNKDFFLPSSI
jgi:hypothetical protein